jgi:hypothetical protein
MSDDREHIDHATLAFLKERRATSKPELHAGNLQAVGEAYRRVKDSELKNMTPEATKELVLATLTVLRKYGNDSLADRYQVIAKRALKAVKNATNRLDMGIVDNRADAAADEAYEDLERVQADVSAFFRSLEKREKGGA